MKKNNAGITLVSLVITIIVLIILASISVYSGISTVRSAKLTKFTTELKIMQQKVNELYDSYMNNRTVNVNGIEYVGKGQAATETEEAKQGVQEIGKVPESIFNTNRLDEIFSEEASGITDKTGYRYYDIETIQALGLEDMEYEFFVNVETRSVVSIEGFNDYGEMYYTLDQVPNGMYNVEYAPTAGVPTFDVSYEQIGDNQWKITISDVQYDGYISKWDVKYQIDGQSYWSTSEDSTFIVTETGNYIVKLANGNIQSDEQKITVMADYEYEKEGLLIYYDAENSSLENGTEDTVKIWKDISGNNNDITLNNIQVNEDHSLSAIDTTTSAIKNINVPSNYTIEVVAKYNTTDIGYLYVLRQNSNCYSYLWNYSDNGNTLSYRYNNSDKNWDVFDNITDETTIVNKKYLISITFNVQQKQAKIYVNGEYIKTVTLNYYNQMENTTLLLFNAPKGDRPLIGGAIYTFRLYNQELTEEQIKNNYTLEQQRYQIP